MGRTTADRRPARERKNVNHYSDDKPDTFTVKPARGSAKEPSIHTSEKKGNSKRARTKNGGANEAMNPKIEEPSVNPARKRRFRVLPRDIGEQSGNTSCAHGVSFQPIVPIHLLEQSLGQKMFSNKDEDVDTLSERFARERHPQIFQASNALSICPAPPTWNPVPTPYREPLLERQGPGGTIVLIDPPPVSCWSNRHRTTQHSSLTSNTAFAVGDCGGAVTIYDSYNGRCRPVALIRTTAWSREQQRSLTSRKNISWPNSIDYISWTDTVLIWASTQEIEIFDTISLSESEGVSFTRTLHLKEKVGSLRLCRLSAHASSSSWHVLWTTGGLTLVDRGPEKSNFNLNHIELEKEVAEGQEPSSSTKVVPVSPAGVDDFECVVAVWDVAQPETTKNASPSVALIVAWTSMTTVDLLRCRTESGEILQRANCWTWPKNENSTKLADLHLLQSQDSMYVFTFGFGGIRVHESSTLQCLQVFGESVSLHGKTIQWIGCQWVRAPDIDFLPRNGHEISVVKQKKISWMECSDPVSMRTGSSSNEHWLVGLPHPGKGPDELRANIHVWKLGYTTSVAVLHAPVGGLLGFGIDSKPGLGWSMVGASPNGNVLEWGPRVQSNFAGAMYPVNYHVIDDNIEYFEKEDELDEPGFFEEVGQPSDCSAKERSRSKRVRLQEETDDELARALQLSLAEQTKGKAESEPVEDLISVLPDHDDIDDMFHSKPDPFLLELQGNGNQCPSSPESPVRKRGPTNAVFGMFPQSKQAHQAYNQMRQDQLQPLPSEVQTSDATNAPKGKIKRSRQANVEALLQASIKPDLRSTVESAQAKWGLGHGSSLDENTLTSGNSSHSNQIQESDKEARSEISKRASPFDASTIDTASLNITLQSNPSPVEKELALELLFLSPGKNGASDTSLSAEKAQQPKPTSFTVEETVVTPSEDEKVDALTETRNCAACRGRLVIHACGKRERPVDYEALEKAESERKKKEQEEREKDRVEKRRAADARRREARKQKKLEEERQRQEEERLRFEAAQRQADILSSLPAVGDMNAVDSKQRDGVPAAKVSSEHVATNAQPQIEADSASTNEKQEWSSLAVRKETPTNGPSSHISFSIDGNEVKPSTSLSSCDALAALAGLAECMPIAAAPSSQPVEKPQPQDEFPPAPASWYNTSAETK